MGHRLSVPEDARQSRTGVVLVRQGREPSQSSIGEPRDIARARGFKVQINQPANLVYCVDARNYGGRRCKKNGMGKGKGKYKLRAFARSQSFNSPRRSETKRSNGRIKQSLQCKTNDEGNGRGNGVYVSLRRNPGWRTKQQVQRVRKLRRDWTKPRLRRMCSYH